MDGPTLEHSDSDSCESWTVLDSGPAEGTEAPAFTDIHYESSSPEINERDEDTDGISVISDSEVDIPIPYTNYNDEHVKEEIRPTEQLIPQFNLSHPHLSNYNSTDETLRANNFLGDSIKHKTYVHKRNKRLSTVLNIIVLGSVITAAGVAIGHMWGAKHDCSIRTTPSVNKILSNLYKLQEENAYLRSKLKELSSYFQHHQKQVNKKPTRCMKTFEESLNNKNAKKFTKCVDDKTIPMDELDAHLVEPLFEKEFIEDVNKLQNVYQVNQSWLDKEIAKRLKNEEDHTNKYLMKQSTVVGPTILGSTNEKENVKNEENTGDETNDIKRVTYADSLKSNNKKLEKREIPKIIENDTKRLLNRQYKSENENNILQSISDEELKKDDRYSVYKQRQDKKKSNRHKSFKKQKRRNKYEQWELKGGFMKDYDDISMEVQDNDYSIDPQKVLVRDIGVQNEANKKTVTESIKQTNVSNNFKAKETPNKKEKKDLTWYEKRSEFRNESRKKLEQEMFGPTAPNTAGWYFRRMQRREQCRTKNDNTTHQKISKHNMNYKIKH
ncbi:uncharacterized protein LOC126967009 [Leptidea sinapis]|uniref:uncharacterized protein LOC126967009 n=1 Tax=Leptidea sinapis TaxID=189913 RepID=UPI002130989D|nr:uncharacterized protein LOC126967009 [Leptidea sinapis]